MSFFSPALLITGPERPYDKQSLKVTLPTPTNLLFHILLFVRTTNISVRDLKQSLANNLITAGHARALLPLVTAAEQIKLCEKIVRKALSVRAVEQIVQNSLFDAGDTTGKSTGGGRKVKHRDGGSNPFQIARLEQELKQALGTKVDIREKAGGQGKIVIQFKNHDEFQRLMTQLANCETEQRRVG